MRATKADRIRKKQLCRRMEPALRKAIWLLEKEKLDDIRKKDAPEKTLEEVFEDYVSMLKEAGLWQRFLDKRVDEYMQANVTSYKKDAGKVMLRAHK